jgi:hypothetical protein
MAQLDSRMDIQFRNYNDQKLLNFAFLGSTYLNRLMDLLQQVVMQVCLTHTFLQRWFNQHFGLLMCNTTIAKWDPHAVQARNQGDHYLRNMSPTKSICHHIRLPGVILNLCYGPWPILTISSIVYWTLFEWKYIWDSCDLWRYHKTHHRDKDSISSKEKPLLQL